MQFVKGPDFPTGASILGRAGIIDAYQTGRGSVKMRATVSIEESRTGRLEILVSEIPYQTSCSAIASRIQELVDSGNLDGIADVNDASSGGKTNLIITLKRDANANVVKNNLFKLTQLQSTFSINMVALVDGVPRQINLRDALVAYVRHQVDVITRRSQFRLDKARRREHILEGRIKALDVIDQIIALIRSSDDAATARAGLMAVPFEFSEIQANDILDMQLRQLTRLSRIDLQTELDDVRAGIIDLQEILDNPERLNNVIREEITAIREEFATPRVCQLTYDDGEMSIEDLVDDKELVIVMTQAQYVKAVEATSFKTQGRGGRGVSGGKLKVDDIVRHVIFTTAHAHLLFFSNRGKVYRLRALDIPERERTAKGMPIVNLLPLQADEKIQAIIDTRDFAGERFLFFATKKGTVKKTAFDAYDSSRRDGLIAINLRDDDELVRVIETSGSDDIFMVSRRGMTIRFAEDDVRPMGRTAGGVRGMRLKPDDSVVSVDVARDDTAILILTEAGLRQAHPARTLQRPGSRWPGRSRHQAHRQEGRGRRGVHGRPRRRDRGGVEQRHHHPHGGAFDLLAGPRRHRCSSDEPRRRRRRRIGRSDSRHRRRLISTLPFGATSATSSIAIDDRRCEVSDARFGTLTEESCALELPPTTGRAGGDLVRHRGRCAGDRRWLGLAQVGVDRPRSSCGRGRRGCGGPARPVRRRAAPGAAQDRRGQRCRRSCRGPPGPVRST